MNELKYHEAQKNWEELFYARDPEADYDFNDIVLFKSKDRQAKYALFLDSGNSCFDPFEDNPSGDVYTKTQLLKLMDTWGKSKDERTEKVMKDWILKNIK